MEQLAPELLAFPPDSLLHDASEKDYDKAVKSHLTRLNKLLTDKTPELVLHGPQLLELLNPAVNSISYLAVLHSLILPRLATAAPQDVVLEKTIMFLLNYDARQCRYAGAYLQDTFNAVGSGSLLPPSSAVEALTTAMLRLDPTGSMFTSSHLSLARLAYTTDTIAPALQLIDKDIVYYPGMANHGNPEYLGDLTLAPPAYISRESCLTGLVKAQQVMEYDLLCGMMYCARREWTKARVAFERVLTFPTRDGGVSKIMVDAHKKWVLVTLLSKGKHSDPPSYTGGAAIKSYSALGKPYITLASLFATSNVQELRMEVEKNSELWSEDGNTGLVKEVMSAYQKWHVLGLQDIYTKISIPEIREQTTSAETGETLPEDKDVEMLVQNMIAEGMLKGVIEKKDGTQFLSFLSPATTLSEQDFAKELARLAARLKELAPIFKATNERLGTSKDYVKYLVKEQKHGNKDEQDPTLGFDAQVDDEDLMGGVIATG
ncbi:hypothetical protein F5Y15DRAFT_410455 [Xylariaceae sp. FL0016]|nr:hypothetical protein F5Y15DRAFT_410455 [Xylariaceae sp. FL0016]